MNLQRHTQPRPLSFSLARLTSSVAIASALTLAAQGQVIWDGASGGTPGDGFLWTNPLNWSLDTLPTDLDDVIFANTASTGPVLLNGDKTVNSLQFLANNYTIGAYGTNNVLTNNSGQVTVDTGNLATLNASYGGSIGLSLAGGGTLFLNHPSPTFSGDITVDGTVAGTTLLHRQEGPGVQYNGIGSAQEFGRFDQVTLGLQRSVRNILLTNGGEYRIFGVAGNPEGNFKNIIIGGGGGTLNLAAGYLLQNLDDIGQIGLTTEAFTKTGKGRLSITGGMAIGTGTAPNLTGGNPLGGIVNVNGGMLDLSNQANAVVGANTYVRFGGIAPTDTTLNVNNGGTFMANNGTNATLDVPAINLNDGSIFSLNGANDHAVGFASTTAAGPTIVTVDGTATWLVRDLFAPQTNGRLPRLRGQLDGTGTLQLLGSTGAGGTPRLVIERNTPGSTFTGTFRLLENTSLEANPRVNVAVNGGTGTTVDTGKVIAGGDVEFAGWGGTLDVRDSNPAAASVLDYTTNEISITTTQAGAVNTIAPVRGTAATGTGHLFNFGTLTMGSNILQIGGNNSYQTGFADTASVTGNAVIRMNSDNSPLVFSNPLAITENAAGRSLTIIKAGAGNAAARDVIVGGTISLSNLEVALGTLQLRGANGAIGTGFAGSAPTINVNGGANNFTNGLPTQGLLHLDNNVGHVVGATTVFVAANNGNRIHDSATVNMRSNSILRLTSLNNSASTETIGVVNAYGHPTFDIIKTGTAPTPVALTMNALNVAGTNATVNFTGTSLGLAGNNTSRIVIPGTATGPLGSQFHSGNEWAKYDKNTVDSGFELGATPFVAADYTSNTAESTWAPGQNVKLTLGGTFLTGSRSVDRFNMQVAGTNTINLNTFNLAFEQGGVITATGTTGFIDTNGAFPGTGGVLSAGASASPAQLYFHANGATDIKVAIANNLAGGAVDFVKSGTATLRLTHHLLGTGAGSAAVDPFVDPTWSSTLTGSWYVNDGRLEVHRGQFLGGRPVVMNGGHLEINQPVSNANADTIIPGWGNNIIVNGNASVVADDNGESGDANTGDRAAVLLGSLAVNNGAILTHGTFSDIDIAYMGGATFAGTPTLNAVRGGVNSATIINGELAGSGFNMVSLNGNNVSLVLGGGLPDAVANSYSGAITAYVGTIRLNKANGTTAITDGPGAEDIILNGGAIAWGPGQHGDLSTTNNINLTNNGLTGRAPTSPAAVLAAGDNQIADTANITMLTGTIGEADRINNETFNALIQKNGTFNVGLGTINVTSATISGGAFGIDRGGTFSAGTLTLQNGAPDLAITTGLPVPGQTTTLAIGAGGLSMSGQNITLGSGSSGNVAGAGAVLRLGGNVTVVGSDLQGGSYGRKGIFIQTANTFRELGDSAIDLVGGTRNFNIDTDVIFTITPRIINGGITKNGGGALVLEPYQRSTFTGAVVVNDGVLETKGDGALGTSAGGVTINSGGTVKLNGMWTVGDDFTVSGPGALIPGGLGVREDGALIAEVGYNRLTGALAIVGGATLAGNTFIDPSITPATGGLPYRIGTLSIEGAGGVTGTGTLSLSGHGDGIIANGVNTTGGIAKDGAGRWILAGPGTYPGVTTVTAGTLRISNGAALGTTAGNTRIYGGALELLGGISVAEPLLISGDGTGVQSGAIVNVSGTNTLTGAISLVGTTIRSASGILNVNGPVTGTSAALTLAGAGNGVINGALAFGPPATGDVLTKTGTGTWTLAVANALSGSTAVNGGSLILSGAGAKLSTISPVNMGGGDLINTGAAQTVNGLNLNSGGGAINGGASGLSVGLITRTAGATAAFAGSVTAVGTANDAGGILGGYATIGSDWARIGGGSAVGALPGASYVDLATATVTDNAIKSTFHLTTAPLAVHSLKISGGNGIDLGANSLTLTSGGILYSSAVPAGIGGAGVISGATLDDELIVHVTGADLDINAPIIGGNGGLTKAGPGRLVMSGNSTFNGAININGGTLSIAGPGGTTPSGGLGGAGNRNLNINGGTFEVVGGDFDPGASTLQFNIGPDGGTIRSTLGSQITINDGSAFPLPPTQLFGSGDLTFTGGGRYVVQGGTPRFSGFTGNVTVESGILTVGDTEALGGRQNQTITLRPGSALIHSAATGLGQIGLPNNVVVEGGVELFGLGGNRAFAGDVHFVGTNTIALLERATPSQERQLHFNGRVTGTGITLNVFGANNGNPMYLGSGANDFTGTINLNENAVLEVRTPGSLGLNTGDVTVNLNGANSRLLLRHFQDANYFANVNVNASAEINSAQLNGFAGGTNQSLTINNLTFVGGDKILSFGGGSAYRTRIAGTATFNGNAIINTAGADVLFENGINFAAGTTLDKRGAGVTMLLRGPSNHTGPTILQAGLIFLDGGGTLPNTSDINLRGGELRVDNSSIANGNRLNDAATVTLGGGVLRITGAETIGTVSAVAGVTQIVSNPTSETVPTPLTLTGFTRQTGAIVQLQAPDLGPTSVGAGTIGQTRISSRIHLPVAPALADSGQTIPGFVGNNAIDFIQYSTTVDSGAILGFRDMRNPGSGAAFATNYTDNAAETAWNDTVILRRTNPTDATTVTDTLTGNRVLDAIKVEAGGTNRDVVIAMTTFNLRIEGGGILDVGNGTHDLNITGTTGVLTGGPAVADPLSTAELVIGGTTGGSAFNIGAIIGDNNDGLNNQSVAVVKVGTNTVSMNGVNTFTGGLHVAAGAVNTTNANGYGNAPSTINLSGGTLTFNIAGGTNVDLGVPDHTINVLASSQINLDNGTGGTDNDISLGSLNINGPYTLRLFSFDSMDASFTGLHTFAGTPTIDMTQAASGGNGTGFFTINGEITGSGFNVGSSGATDNTTSVLQIGGGDGSPNTYTGKVTVLLGVGSVGSFSEDLRVELNKAPGTTAITGDLEINGGTVRNIFADQIADTSNLVINQGQYDAFGQNETIASVTMRGGNFRTSSPGTGGGTVTVTGDFTSTGADNLTGSVDGVAVNSNSNLVIGGILRMNGYSAGTVGATNATLTVGGLEMTGTTLTLNASGNALMRLNGDVTTLPSSNIARLGNNTTTSSLELNGTRTFNVADGPAGLDLSVSTAIVDSTTPVAAGSLVKNGPGSMQFEGSGQVNAYTGGTTVNAGALLLFKSIGTNAIPAGTLTIGDGVGGAKADQVIIRNNNQIADTASVVLATSGLLDLDTFNTSETIGDLTGVAGSAITLGPNSTLTVASAGTTTYSGSIGNGGTLTKAGAGTLRLNGDLDLWVINANAGTLDLDADGNLAVVNVNNAGTVVTVGVSQTLTALNIGDGATVILDGLAPAPSEGGAPEAGLAFSEGGAAASFGGEASSVAVVPEPGSVALLAFGALGLLGRRRRQA